jgi:nucleotide-binding universal stress UspA family protein
MTYATLMAHLEAGRSNGGLLHVVQRLVSHFDAHVIGIAACLPAQISDREGYPTGALRMQEKARALVQLQASEAEFRAALSEDASRLEWRSTTEFDTVGKYLAQEARGADLLVSAVASGALLDSSRRVALGELVMELGRPLLVVPDQARPLNLDWVTVGWTDTPEARRAVHDALPLLQKAVHVSLVEIADKDDLPAARRRLDEVAAWLQRHGVVAEPLAAAWMDEGASRLYDIAHEQGADLIVAGAYGHGRLHEWVLGGVTQDLLRRSECCSLVAH